MNIIQRILHPTQARRLEQSRRDQEFIFARMARTRHFSTN